MNREQGLIDALWSKLFDINCEKHELQREIEILKELVTDLQGRLIHATQLYRISGDASNAADRKGAIWSREGVEGLAKLQQGEDGGNVLGSIPERPDTKGDGDGRR